MMYSASLRLHFADAPLAPPRHRLPAPRTTSTACCSRRFAEHPDDPGKLEYFLGAGLVVWAAWQAAVLGGVLIGAGVPAAWRLEFAAPLAFIAISIPFLRDRATIAAALAAGAAVVLAQRPALSARHRGRGARPVSPRVCFSRRRQ